MKQSERQIETQKDQLQCWLERLLMMENGSKENIPYQLSVISLVQNLMVFRVKINLFFQRLDA
jgi:hypothetical protein